MGPKKGKDTIDDDSWRKCIEEALLDDDSWNVKVILIEASGSDQDRIYLDKFETNAAEGKRFVVKNISKTETIFMVNQLGGEKKVKDDSLRVFEEGQAFLKEKRNIPSEVLALIIKHLILKMKVEYLFIKQQRLQVRDGMKRESATIINEAEIRGTVNVKSLEPPELPSRPLTGKKAEVDTAQKPLEIEENKKYSTLLRVRGEEWRDKVYIDDYPSDGPSLYVAITGFVEPHLPRCLIKIGIPLTAVVQIRIDLTATTTIPSSLFRASKRGQSQTHILAEKSIKFWEDLQQLRISKLSADDFNNTAFLVFSPPYWNNTNLSGSHDKIYDEICFLMYDIQDLSRQHIHYLKNMNVINIPCEHKDNRYLHVYDRYIDGIPVESVTSYLILDSILQTVSGGQNEISVPSLSTAVTINQIYTGAKDEQKLQQSENLVLQFIDELCQIESSRTKYRFSSGDELENHKNSIVINYGDFCKYNMFHLDNIINLDDIVWRMLFDMPINKLWLNKNKPTGELEAKINFHLNVLLSCFDRTDVESAELNRLIHILTCRKIYNNRSSLKKNHLLSSTISEFKKKYLKRSILAEPLSISTKYKCASSTLPSFHSIQNIEKESNTSLMYEENQISRIKLLFDCPDLSELVSAAEIAIEKPISHMIDEFEYFEDFTGTDAFQVIFDSFTKFNCVDYKYCDVTDCFVMMFFNSHDKDGISREEWRFHLPTPICLQDFFDFVLEEHYDWVKNEEKIYDDNIVQRFQSEFTDFQGPLTTKSCVDKTEVDMELLMEGSLKYEQIANSGTPSSETSESKIFSSNRTSPPLPTFDKDSKSSKKGKSLAPATKGQNPKSDEPKEQSVDKHFLGYDLGDRRVEVFGRDSIFFSKDGTRISSIYYLLIPMNLEYVMLNIAPGNVENEFWMHKAIDKCIRPELIDTCESFRIKTKDRITMYVKKRLYQTPVLEASNSTGNTYKEFAPKSSLSDKKNLSPQIYETRSYHSLYVTWPNGLITESVYENNSADISHIKQYYLSPPLHFDEEMRCVSLNGEVVIFKCNGDINILKPDASYINITKCENRIVSDELLEVISTVASSNKSKKGKGKDKPRKTSSKSSNSSLTENEKQFDSTPVEYKLVIEEFEVIESNGLRQKWKNDSYINIEKLLIRTATDYCVGEIFSKRMDGTNTLLKKDGVQLVIFPDNTRILSKFIIEDEEIFPEWNKEEIEHFAIFAYEADTSTLKSSGYISQKDFTASYTNNNSETILGSENVSPDHMSNKNRSDGYISVHIIYTIEHPNFTTITIDKCNGKLVIESPNNICVTLDKDNHYEFLLDNRTSATFDGDHLNINYQACSDCKSFTTCEVKVKSEDISSVNQSQRNWLKMTDSFCKNVTVDEEGNINVLSGSFDQFVHNAESHCSEELLNSMDQNQNKDNIKPPTALHGKCSQMCEAKSLKFFILARDLTCSELVHRDIIEEYKETCCLQPWCTINEYDTFGGHRSLWSVLTPIYRNESEKWLMESKMSDKPSYLTCKDLKLDSGTGFYHWMRPYKHFQAQSKKIENVLPERLPKAFILRILEQQWKEDERAELKGAKELLNAIFRYRHLMESDCETILHVPIHDPRPEDERRTDEKVQAIAHRICEDLKIRLEEDVHTRAKPNITTRARPQQDNMSVQGEEELYEDPKDELNILEVDRALTVESSVKMSPNLQRYWRHRDEQLKEEQFHRYLLREGRVPAYFQNIMGGAIWWEMEKVSEDAMTKAEQRQMKCVCYDQESDH